MKKITLVGVLLVVVSTVWAQQMYQWRDVQGKVHYTDNPVEAKQKQASVIEKDQLTKINTIPAQSSTEDISYRRQQEAYMLQQQREVADQRERIRGQCEKEYNRLQNIKKDPPRMVDITSDGSRHYYSDEEIQAFVQKRELEYSQNCSNY